MAVGTSAEMMLTPYGALIVGFICGIVSTVGYVYLTVSAALGVCSPGAAKETRNVFTSL